MSTEIYAQNTFSNQANGSVFYKEGKLNDPMLGNVNGVFQSWKYSFDSGKQLFKVSDSEKVYEKRLIKDPNGNPHWGNWVEICPGEANGIQAIAINNQPLLLPNEDGAIKLQITPQMIDTYTKREIYDMINAKLDEIETSGYVYVHWVDGCESPTEVLESTFPDGGELSRFYLVEPKTEEGVANVSTYWICNENGEWKQLKDLPNLKAFVSQIAFNEHIQDKIIHVSQEDRDRWDGQVSFNEETKSKLDEVNSVVNDHITNIDKPNSPHITPEEREKLLHAYENLKDMPDGEGRYIIENKKYVKDYIQYDVGGAVKSVSLKNYKTQTYKNGDALIALDENFEMQYASIENRGNFIKEMKINFSNIILPLNVTWQLEADNGWTSEVYSSINQSATVEIPVEKLPKILNIKLSNTDSSITIGTSDYLIEYSEKTALSIGDDNKVLPINFIGPEDALPLYNGVPLNELTNEDAGSAKWGKIYGNVELQEDLIRKVNELVKTKVENPEMDEAARYDIYGNGTLKSIIQNIGEEKVDTIAIPNGTLKENKILFEGLKQKIKILKSGGYFVTNVKLVAENIACTNDANGDIIPVYFETDNVDNAQSPSVVGSFEYNWPAKPNFDKIYLRGGKIDYITNAHIEIKYVAFSDIKIGLLNEITNKYYNIALNADELKLDANEVLLKASDEIDILANAIYLGQEYSYDDEKTTGKVYIYGEEIDNRYAAKEEVDNLKQSIESNNNELAEISARITASEERVTSVVSDLDGKSAEIDGKIVDFDEKLLETDRRLSNIDETIQESIKNLLKADEENAEGDASVFARVSSLEEETSVLKEDLEQYAKIEELSSLVGDATHEKFDLIINDSGELTDSILSGAFEKAERILFHKGEYSFTNTALYARRIDFTNIKYVKGEIPCKIECIDVNQVDPINYKDTVFENIDFTVGKVSISEGEKYTYEVTTSGKTSITIHSYCDIIRLNVEDNSEITLIGGIEGKDYTIHVCQPSEVKNVKFTNFFVNKNAIAEFSTGLENQKPGNKTVIDITADNSIAKDAFIIKNVIYGALEGSDLDGLVKVIAKDTTCKLFKSNTKEQAVAMAEGELIGSYQPGTTFTINAKILDGFAHNEEGYDYTVIASNGIEIGKGVCEQPQTFTVPMNLTSEDEIHVEFNVSPQLVTYEIDPEYEEYVVNLKGFVPVQTKFGTTSLQFAMRSGFYAYAYQKGDEAPTIMGQESLPWVFKTPARKSRKNFTIYVKPLFVALFSQFKFKTLSPYEFDKSKICLVGHNEFDIEAKMSSKVLEDSNYGGLYSQALLTLLPNEGYENGSIEITSNGKDQTMTAKVDPEYAGRTITFKFGLPNGDVITKEMYAAKIDQFKIVNDTLEMTDGKYTLDTIINENRKYKFTADLESSNEINDFSGKWTISDSTIASIDSINNNEIVIQAKKKGIVKLSFKSNFTGLSSSVVVEVITHAAKVAGPDNMVVKQLEEFTPQLKWYDFNGLVCQASEISDTTGVYTTEYGYEEYLEDSYEKYLVVKSTSINAPSKEAFYRFKANDETVESELSRVTIVPTELLISFGTDNPDITGVKVFNANYFNNNLSEYNCKAHPESMVTFIITLKTGATLPDRSIRAIENAFGTTASKALNVQGRATIEIQMPYKPVIFRI